MDEGARRESMISKGWVQGVLIVVLAGFAVLLYLAYATYKDEPPIPKRVVDPSGQVLFTGDDIHRGQEVFLSNGLMEFGSVFGHGAYLGPDFTADYLHRAADLAQADYGGATSDSARQRTIRDFQANRYDARTSSLRFSAAQANAFGALKDHYYAYFSDPRADKGLMPKAITDRSQTDAMTAFFAWSAWAAAARRPGHNYSYTNSWPPEPLVGNRATANVIVWSLLSLVVLLGGIGLLFGVFGRWRALGWHGREQATRRSAGRATWR